jgi:effector-binding domain-containing protein
MKRLRSRSLLLLSLLCFSTDLMAAAAAFPATDPGTTEIKTLPAGVLLKSSTPVGNYFDHNGALFRPLFRYISSHDIAMTVPVEATIEDAAMFFWVARNQESKVTESQDGVEVVRVPARRVAAHGFRGSYSAENFNQARDTLIEWVKSQPELTPIGEPYAVYWNGPFIPGFFKRFEVHLALEPAP